MKSPSEVRRLQDILAAPDFLDIRSLALTFDSDPDVLAELIPPPLEPGERPQVSISVSEIRRSNCVGPFNGCSVNIACSYQGQPGLYCLTMPMSTDIAVIFGRELFAEPKKLAEIHLDVRGEHARGTVTRHGITYIEIAGHFPDPMAPVDRAGETHHYYFKYLPAADGRGLAADPELVRVTHHGRVFATTRGTGTIILRESNHDPVIDLPVLDVTGASLSEVETRTRAEVVATIPAREFLPWAYGKLDDLTVWATDGVLATA